MAAPRSLSSTQQIPTERVCELGPGRPWGTLGGRGQSPALECLPVSLGRPTKPVGRLGRWEPPWSARRQGLSAESPKRLCRCQWRGLLEELTACSPLAAACRHRSAPSTCPRGQPALLTEPRGKVEGRRLSRAPGSERWVLGEGAVARGIVGLPGAELAPGSSWVQVGAGQGPAGWGSRLVHAHATRQFGSVVTSLSPETT